MASTLRKAGSGLRLRNSGNSFETLRTSWTYEWWGPVEHINRSSEESEQQQLQQSISSSWEKLDSTSSYTACCHFPLDDQGNTMPTSCWAAGVFINQEKVKGKSWKSWKPGEAYPPLSLSLSCWPFGLVGCLAAVCEEKQEMKRM